MLSLLVGGGRADGLWTLLVVVVVVVVVVALVVVRKVRRSRGCPVVAHAEVVVSNHW